MHSCCLVDRSVTKIVLQYIQIMLDAFFNHSFHLTYEQVARPPVLVSVFVAARLVC